MGEKIISKYFLVVLLYFILIANALAIWQSWYFKTTWFDIPMHFLGGAWLALLFLLYFKKYFKHPLIFLFVFVILVGLGWEVFEYFNEWLIIKSGRVPIAPMTLNDTFLDLLIDVLGGMAIFAIYRKPTT